jgi:lincosamide nucleotidyltransferase A/C/D/E
VRAINQDRNPRLPMAADHVVQLLDRLEQAGIDVWLDGGWGVDALLSAQTREHDDLDLVASLSDARPLIETLALEGYEHVAGALSTNFVLLDDVGRQVDVHPVAFTETGDGVYRMQNGEDWIYPASGFSGEGRVLGRAVRCLTAETQVLCHTGYELHDSDYHDMHALRDRFGVALLADHDR